MEPQTLLRSAYMRLMANPARRSAAHTLGAVRRIVGRQPPTIEYFHQADDPYSHLAVQRLRCLSRRYVVRIRPHLVSAPAPEFIGDAERFPAWALRDAADIAPHLDLEFRAAPASITAGRLQAFSQKLAAMLTSEDFGAKASELGEAFWSGEPLSDEPGLSRPATEARVHDADELRRKLGHYASGTFYFEGEWYAGVDRLRHLEARLREMNLCNDQIKPFCMREPRIESATGAQANDVTLEFYPSLRSPYTAISYLRVMDLVKRSGVTLKLRPVMPMMMRGVPAPRAKGNYILSDAKREGVEAGVPFGKIVDPFGEPVKMAFSLYPWAREKGKHVEYLGAYLGAAFSKGVNITNEKGLERVVKSVGLNWEEGSKHLGKPGWEAELEENINDMLADGLWGVPSFKVYGGNSTEAYSTWGQDRLWRVETEIARRASS
ncbi:MAG: DsbA family protein [Gammaproteobacteria bacterium]|nr:DsbA family protein [Gammaproteobacteria bacterium]